MTLKVIPAIPDRMFGVADNDGNTTSHKFFYLPVTNPDTGKTWLNNNLGANYANLNSPDYNPAQQATASTDYKAYGSLFQWGRKADGHELINWTNGGTGTGVHGTTATKSDAPTDALFITADSGQYDWRVNQDDTLWASESSTNNVCPAGYRLPLNPNGANDSANEFYTETQTWGSQDPAGALGSVLKLPMPGYRNNRDGSIVNAGSTSFYWSGSVTESDIFDMSVSQPDVDSLNEDQRAYGQSVRCIKN